MELANLKLWITNLKAQVALREYMCASLAKEFENPDTPSTRRTALAYRWDATLKEGHFLQLLIDLLEKQEREGKIH